MGNRKPQVRISTLSRCLMLGLAVTVGGMAPLAGAYAQSQQPATGVVDFNIPAGELATVLDQFAEQSGLQIVSQQSLQGVRVPALRGRYAPEEALKRLLQGSGFGYERLNAQTLVLKKQPVAARPEPQAGTRNAPATTQSDEPEIQDIGRVTVTGTRIRGAQLTSPLVTISQEEMLLSGHNNLGEALRALPQNFGGGQNPGVVPGSGGVHQNITGSSSPNLRGLGPDATLTLLNGARMAYDGFIQAVDLSVVPTAALDRVEVLLDGASAIYGSDAVGGVVNAILKRDYDGAELTVRYGAATDGGYSQMQFTGVAGTTWDSGGFLISADSSRNKAALASQRDYMDYLEHPDLVSIYPETSQTSALFSGHQQLGSRAEMALDAYYLDRSSSRKVIFGSAVDTGTETSIYGVSPSLAVDLPREWSLRLVGFSGENDSRLRQVSRVIGGTGPDSDSLGMYRNRTHAAGVELEGALLEVPAGEARLSLGGGWKKSEYEQANLRTGNVSIPTSSNSNQYGYAEIDVPLVADEHGIRFVRRLSLNGALRHENYDTFGSETTPKMGAMWSVTHSLDVRASWGKSFKAPTLPQQYSALSAFLFAASEFGVADAPADATALRVIGGNPNLDPERAEVTTAGVVFRPSFLPGLTFDLGWFDIDYVQRVVRPLVFASNAQYGPTLDDPAYSDYSIRNPSAALQSELTSSRFSNISGMEYDPAKVVALFDNREMNASSQVVRGIDIGIQYAASAFGGTFSVNANGSWITEARRTLIEGGEPEETAGVLGHPPKFKGRLGASWSRSALALAVVMNHTGGIRNTVFTPSPKGGAMTTLDLVVDYRAQPDVFGGFGLNLAIMNALNQRPPYLQPSQPYWVNYDSTNYSAVGRSVSLAISKRF